jgi:anti-sigma regulatory factor (Ser/Thr protein kinase)
MTGKLFAQGRAGGPDVDDPTPLTRVGQVFLDVQRRQLSFLDPVARQLYQDGIPFTPADLEVKPLYTPDGEAVAAADLPLIVAWREERPVEATFVLAQAREPRWRVTWNAAPVRDGDGAVLGIAGTIRYGPPEPDWPAMAGLAHDLRTPLNAITLQLAVLNHLTAANPELSRILDGVQSSAERALRVGLDLLHWCRGPGQQGKAAERAWFPLEPLLAQLAREQEPVARTKNLALAADLAACHGWEVHTDRIRLARVLSNLLVNAVRYTARGRVEFTASWREGNPGGALAVGIVDTGAGISPEEQESIFQPFERGKAGKESDSGGSGLGLAVVDRLVEELGVELEVYSEHGRGSAFHLVLPAAMLRAKA